jgi:hypothetical protein
MKNPESRAKFYAVTAIGAGIDSNKKHIPAKR